MPIYSYKNYTPVFPFKNAHINTIYTGLFRKPKTPKYQRQRISTHDQDFFIVDWLKAGSKKLVILAHGLEGSIESQYIKSISNLYFTSGFDVAAYTFRSCGGEMNDTIHMYHSGFTDDLNQLVREYTNPYHSITFVGVSLGGNMMLKYLTDGRFPILNKIKNAIILSAPIDLSGSAQELRKWKNYLYDRNFCFSLSKKIELKGKQFPDQIELKYLKKVKKLIDIDEYYTGPIHGFDGAEDYYSKCNALQFIDNINIPILMICSKDDSFLSPKSIPTAFAKSNPYLHLLNPNYGGHVGFYTKGSTYFWNENAMLKFVIEN